MANDKKKRGRRLLDDLILNAQKAIAMGSPYNPDLFRESIALAYREGVGEDIDPDVLDAAMEILDEDAAEYAAKQAAKAPEVKAEEPKVTKSKAPKVSKKAVATVVPVVPEAPKKTRSSKKVQSTQAEGTEGTGGTGGTGGTLKKRTRKTSTRKTQTVVPVVPEETKRGGSKKKVWQTPQEVAAQTIARRRTLLPPNEAVDRIVGLLAATDPKLLTPSQAVRLAEVHWKRMVGGAPSAEQLGDILDQVQKLTGVSFEEQFLADEEAVEAIAKQIGEEDPVEAIAKARGVPVQRPGTAVAGLEEAAEEGLPRRKPTEAFIRADNAGRQMQRDMNRKAMSEELKRAFRALKAFPAFGLGASGKGPKAIVRRPPDQLPVKVSPKHLPLAKVVQPLKVEDAVKKAAAAEDGLFKKALKKAWKHPIWTGLGLAGVFFDLKAIKDVVDDFSGKEQERELKRVAHQVRLEQLRQPPLHVLMAQKELEEKVERRARLIESQDPGLAQILMGLPETTRSEVIVGGPGPDRNRMLDFIRQDVMSEIMSQ